MNQPLKPAPMAGDVDFVGPWNNFLSSISGIDGVLTVVAVFGVIIVVVSLISWIWKKRRGGGAGGFPVMAVGLGALLAAPKAVIPVVLLILQWIVNICIGFVEAMGGLGGA